MKDNKRMDQLISEEWITKNKLQKIYGYPIATYYRRRNECLASPYSDAVIRVGNATYIISSLWRKFLIWKARKNTRTKQGLE